MIKEAIKKKLLRGLRRQGVSFAYGGIPGSVAGGLLGGLEDPKKTGESRLKGVAKGALKGGLIFGGTEALAREGSRAFAKKISKGTTKQIRDSRFKIGNLRNLLNEAENLKPADVEKFLKKYPHLRQTSNFSSNPLSQVNTIETSRQLRALEAKLDRSIQRRYRTKESANTAATIAMTPLQVALTRKSLGTIGGDKKNKGNLGSMGVSPSKIRTSTRKVRSDKGRKRGPRR